MLPFLSAFLVLLLSRSLYWFRDRAVTAFQSIFCFGLQAAALLVLFPLQDAAIIAGCVLALITAGAHFSERWTVQLSAVRLIDLVAKSVVLAICLAPARDLAFRVEVYELLRWIDYNSVLSLPEGEAAKGFLILVSGGLLVVNEANLLLRIPFEFGIIPKPPSTATAGNDEPPTDEAEYRLGRFVGILERLMMYVFVLNGAYPAIGLVMAAKGIARYKELDDKVFAEYVLVGSLMSLLLGLCIAESVRILTT